MTSPRHSAASPSKGVGNLAGGLVVGAALGATFVATTATPPNAASFRADPVVMGSDDRSAFGRRGFGPSSEIQFDMKMPDGSHGTIFFSPAEEGRVRVAFSTPAAWMITGLRYPSAGSEKRLNVSGDRETPGFSVPVELTDGFNHTALQVVPEVTNIDGKVLGRSLPPIVVDVHFGESGTIGFKPPASVVEQIPAGQPVSVSTLTTWAL